MFNPAYSLGAVGPLGDRDQLRHSGAKGYVDETWDREHHEYWYRDIKAGKVPGGEAKPADRVPPMRPAEE